MSILKTGTGTTLVRVGASAALALATLVAVGTSSQAGVSALTSSTTIGPPAGTNTITLTIPAPTVAANNKFTTGTLTTIPEGVQFQYNATPSAAGSTCTTNPATNAAVAASAGVVTAVTVRYLSSTKISVVVPDLSAGAANTFMVCVYNANGNSGTISSSATVLAKGSYNTSTPPGTPTILPISGPALGGQAVTITSSALPTSITTATPLTATLGGTPLLNIVAVDANHFTAVTPAHVASTAQAVVVTTAGGSKSGGTYAFKNGIVISPDTVVSGASADIDIQGVGFLGASMTFTPSDEGVTSAAHAVDGTHAGTNSTHAHVYLVAGTYNGASFAVGANKTNGQLSECANVAVISDTELICTMDTAQTYVAASGAYTWTTASVVDGTYTVTIVNDGEVPAPAYQTVISSGSTLTVAAF